MAWSDWQVDEEYFLPPKRLDLFFDAASDGTINPASGAHAAWYDPSTSSTDTEYFRGYGSGTDVHEGAPWHQFSPPDGWGTYKPLSGTMWFPQHLYDLTPGRDYGIQPGRSYGDVDAYVEYDTGSTVHRRWDTNGDPELLVDDDPTGTVFAWRAGILLGAGYVPGPLAEAPAFGSQFATGPGGLPAFTSIAPLNPYLPLPGDSVQDFVVTVRIDDGSVVLGPSGHLNANVHIGVTPYFVVMPPRYRYWIPGEAPLRQRQRDDGRGLSGTPRWRGGSSRQSSNRWRTYL